MKYYLGLDVGGTNLAAGIVDENYHLLHKESIPAGAGRSVEDITEDMAKVSKSVIKHLGLPISKISSWGIGMPSYINPKTGLLVHANCFGWKNIDIYSYLQKQISLPIYIENDANCAAMGENLVLLEVGVGFNTPTIIRFPFEKLAREHKNIQRIRWNLDDAAMPEDLDVRGIGIEGDLACVIPQL